MSHTAEWKAIEEVVRLAKAVSNEWGYLEGESGNTAEVVVVDKALVFALYDALARLDGLGREGGDDAP